MFTANWPACRTASCVLLAAFRQTSSIGGSSDSDEMALTVAPWYWPPCVVVITTTPLMKLPITRRNTALSKADPVCSAVRASPSTSTSRFNSRGLHRTPGSPLCR
jgi:hypothetical protein